VSTATAPTPTAAPAPFKPGLVARAVAAFSGTPGHVLKMAFLAMSNALAVWAAYVLVDQSRWISLTILVAATAAIDLIYLAPRRGTLPLKFLVPGTVFLLAFQIIPIVYTIEVALSNYSTGHIISKADAIQQIKINSLQQPENGRQYEAAPARNKDGELVTTRAAPSSSARRTR
jgi:arabinogalactan oligomer/maltooligosaccharide transport system permease protein